MCAREDGKRKRERELRLSSHLCKRFSFRSLEHRERAKSRIDSSGRTKEEEERRRRSEKL